jgi:ribonuclease M5
LIILTDSDGAGGVIRSFIKGILPPEKLFNLYIPRMEGKEKRKEKPSAEGYLGVEGIEKEILVKVLSPFIKSEQKAEETPEKCKELITKSRFYLDGLTGSSNSSARRNMLAKHYNLPEGMSSGALIEALNIISNLNEYEDALKRLGKGATDDLVNYSEKFDKYRQSKAAEISNNINDSYLEANGQKEGTRAYDMVTDLVVAYYKSIR